MLHRNKFLLFIAFVGIVSSCYEKKKTHIPEFNSLEYEKQAEKVSKEIIGLDSYAIIQSNFADSVALWKKYNLVKALNRYPNRLDSLMCFNQKGDKMITAILYQCDLPACSMDDISYIYGVKITADWYFFRGPSLGIPREKGKSLTFEELHEKAVENVFNGYLRKSRTGEWEVNERFFDRIEFQFEKWAYWDGAGKEVDNSRLSKDSLTKLFLKKIVYEKWKER